MKELFIRNDDVGWGTSLEEFKAFCDVCDKYGVKIIQAITPIGDCWFLDSSWDNNRIIKECGDKLLGRDWIEYLQSRKDLISTHGLMHTHCPSVKEISASKTLLSMWGLKAEFCTWPFNEATTDELEFNGLKTLGKSQRLEDYLPGMSKWGQVPTEKIVYLHSWRFFRGWYDLERLEKCLQTITTLL